MPSSIKITFISNVSVDSIIDLKINSSLIETFKTTRLAIYQTKIDSTISAQRDEYYNSFVSDYNGFSFFDVVKNGTNEVLITHPASDFFTNAEVSNTTNGAVTTKIASDGVTITPIGITDVSFTNALNPCSHVRVGVTTDILADKIFVATTEIATGNLDNPFFFETIRAVPIGITVASVDGESLNQTIVIPDILSVSNSNINIINSPTGATVSVLVTDINGLILEYSLDNITFQSSNIFTNILEGTHTVYVKDQLGCSFQIDFIIGNFATGGIGVNEPNIIVSELNSFRFVEIVDFATTHKTDENTLSCQAFSENEKLAYREIQQYLTNDSPKNQIKTNYNNVTAVVIDELGVETSLVLTKETSYMGLKARMDAIKYDLGDGKTGIYFTAGNTYDPVTGSLLSTYSLNGGLPYWGTIGQYVFFEGGWFEIENTYWDDFKNAKILVISNAYTGFDAVIDIQTIYNRENYEVYDFVTYLSAFKDQEVQVRIDFKDTRFVSRSWISEKIHTADVQKDTVEVICFNDTNTDIYYQTGITHLRRILLERKDSAIDDSTDIHKTDAQSVLLETKIFPLKKFVFSPMTDGFRWKTVLQLSCDSVIIDGENYIKNGSGIEHDDAEGKSNLYVVTATMLKAGKGYNSNGIYDSSFAPIDVPNLVSIDGVTIVKI